jgi:hypothetical protein
MTPEDVVRRALSSEAERVEFGPDALGSIRSRINRRTRQRRRMTMGLASVTTGALATVTAVVVGVASCVPPQPNPTTPPGGTSTSGPGPTGTGAPPIGTAVRLPVYYLGTASNRTVLYREFRSLTPADGSLPARITAAVTEMLTARPLDPDYAGGWPAGASVRDVRLEGGVAVVDIAGAAANSVGAETAELTVQQLVWTVTAVAADAGTQVGGVRLLIDGSAATDLWGHVAVGGVLTRAAALQTQAPLYLISPQHGDTVESTFTVHLDGAVFEATAQLWVRGPGGTTVVERTVTLSAGGPSRGQAFVELTLPSGDYSLEVFYFSPEDGSVQGVDDHDITVH